MEKIRLLNSKNAYAKKFKTLTGLESHFADVLGEPEAYGIWIVYGKEKHGKTLCSLMLANALSNLTKVVYISAEEGISQHFQDTMSRLNIDANNPRLFFSEYISIDELRVILGRRNAPKVVFVDNVTAMIHELRQDAARKLSQDFPNVLFVYVAHQEKNEPYTAIAKKIKIWAKAIFRVEGLRVMVSGRVPGGEYNLHEAKAWLYHGQN
ncbi:RecA family protein [Sphingobacterium psychroaquaticum]|uniref:AAA+ ATPase domain-containing protein n=1 Tax=Sphingobacterium psychroaquaticum TaxID=561061 RepID=A0A1X7K4Y5_9SPHI|nr:hypothetical protein [Sphingobacterium psychroaquaticum]SMG35797.1 hypothetical protein SAMN05660862_2550 [Sphingobacterium psychroaquaticum]